MTRVGPTTVVLASASPRRLELLGRLGVSPTVVPADVDESVHDGESAEAYVARVATDKAAAVAAARSGAIVIGADTAVVLDGESLGKPDGPADALDMLGRLVGRSHTVLTAVTVISPDGERRTETSEATVTMADATSAELEWYVATGEPLDKAGAYAIQGIGAFLVERLDGDHTTVIGLPLRATIRLLHAAGLAWPSE